MTNRQRALETMAEKIEASVREMAAERADCEPEDVSVEWCSDGELVASTKAEDNGYRWTISSDGTVEVTMA